MIRHLTTLAIGLVAGAAITLAIAMALGVADAIQDQRIERPLS